MTGWWGTGFGCRVRTHITWGISWRRFLTWMWNGSPSAGCLTPSAEPRPAAVREGKGAGPEALQTVHEADKALAGKVHTIVEINASLDGICLIDEIKGLAWELAFKKVDFSEKQRVYRETHFLHSQEDYFLKRQVESRKDFSYKLKNRVAVDVRIFFRRRTGMREAVKMCDDFYQNFPIRCFCF